MQTYSNKRRLQTHKNSAGAFFYFGQIVRVREHVELPKKLCAAYCLFIIADLYYQT